MMTTITPNYPTVALGDVLRKVERFEVREDLEEYPFAGTYSFARGIFVGEVKRGSTFKLPKIQRLREGDFVYSKIMAWEGAFGLVPAEAHDCVMSGAFVAYEPDKTQVEPKYLAHYFKLPHVWRSIGAQSTGTNIRRRSLHPKQFEAARIPLPPLSEQQHIVAHIEELAARIREARGLRRQAVEEAEVLITSSLSNMFDFRTNDILPDGWVWKPLNSLLAHGDVGMTTGPFGTTLSKSDLQPAGVPILGIANVQANRFIPGFRDYVSSSKADDLSVYELKADDIVIARSGTVGRSCVVPPGMEPAPIMSTNLIRLRLNSEVFLPRLLSSLFNGSRLVERHKDAECRGSTRSFFTQKILFKLQIPVPPLAEQHRIVNYLHSLEHKVEALKGLQDETAAELDALLPSVLDQAFKGQL